MKRAWGACFATLFCVSSGAQVPSSNASAVQQLEQVFAPQLRAQSRDDDLLEKTVTSVYGASLTPDKRRVAKSSIAVLLGNPGMPAYLARALAPKMGPNLSPADGKALVQQAIGSLKTKGMRRLPVSRQVQYVQYLLGVAAFASPADCKALFTGTIDTARGARIENEYLAAQTFDVFQATSKLLQEASEAELSGSPSVRTLHATQAQAAKVALDKAAAVRVDRMPPGLNQRFVAAGSAADPRDACMWYRETTAAVLDLQEPELGWHMVAFFDGF